MVDVNVELKTGQGVIVTPSTRASAVTTIGRASVSPVISKTQGASISDTQKQVSVEVGAGQTRDNYLSALKDVLLTTLLDNQLLKYNSASGKWLNWTPNFLTSFSESDPIFSAWDKSTGISITESQISDFGSYQILSDNLTSLSGLSYSDTAFVKMTSAGTFSLDTNTYYKSGDDAIFSSVYAGGGVFATSCELLTDYDFDDAGEWVTTGFTVASGRATHDGNPGGSLYQANPFTVEIGKTYAVCATIYSNYGNPYTISLGGVSRNSVFGTAEAGKTHTYLITASTAGEFYVTAGGGCGVSFTAISIKEIGNIEANNLTLMGELSCYSADFPFSVAIGTETSTFGYLTLGARKYDPAGGVATGGGVLFYRGKSPTESQTDPIVAGAIQACITGLNFTNAGKSKIGFYDGIKTSVSTTPLFWVEPSTGHIAIQKNNGRLYFGEGTNAPSDGDQFVLDTYIGYTGTYWDFDIQLATTAIRFNQSQLDTDFIVYGDTGAMMTLNAGDLSATFGAYVNAVGGYKDNGTAGIDTTFLDADGNTITVSGGIITAKTAP